MKKRIAIIDCGTNTFHLLIVQLENGKADTLLKEKTVVKIGEGGINQRIILQEAFERAVNTICDFNLKIKSYDVNNIYCFATSAFRNANNGELLKQTILTKTGIDVQIIPGEIEAELIFRGVNVALDIGADPALVMDIGGGSVEFIIGTSNKIYWKESFELGAQRLVHLFHHTEPIATTDLNKLFDFLETKLESLLSAIKEFNPRVVIGSSGTFDTLSDMHCEKIGCNKDSGLKEVPLTFDSFEEIYKSLIVKNKEERLKIPGMIAMRVDMIVVASALIKFTLEHHSFQSIRVSTYALKEGVLDKIIKKEL